MMDNLILTLAEKEILVNVTNGELVINAPNGVLTPELIQTIKAHKAELIDYLTGISINNPGQDIIHPSAEKINYPLSSSQRSLWIMSQLEGSVAYNMPAVYVFEGNLDHAALDYSFRMLLERHEILRTVFRENDLGEVRQFIHQTAASGFELVHTDLRKEENAEETVRAIVQEETSRSFDLASGPLLRAGIYQVADHRWIFSCTMHHIINDAWSMRILIKELLQLYNSYILKEENPLSPLPIQYKDYAAWQQEQLGTDAFNTHKDYWLKQFEGELPVLDLPLDKQRAAVKTYNGGVSSLLLKPEVVEKLQGLCQEQNGTFFMGLLAVVKTLLFRYTGQEDIIVGRVVAGRENIDLENQIGFYVNTLALRTQFNGTDNFRELLGKVKDVVLGAYEHKVYPFDELIESMNIQWESSRNPLFDVMIDMKGADIVDTTSFGNLADIKVSSYDEDLHVTSKFDLTFFFTELPEGLKLDLEYNNDLFDESTILRMTSHLDNLLSAVVTTPSAAIGKLDYIGEKEQRDLLDTFNRIPANYSEYRSMLELFDIQVKQNPGNKAVESEGVSLTYAELDEKSNQLANYLRITHGVVTGDLIGIMMGRSEYMIVAILGILKSGAAYVPIDPEYPAERKKYIMTDTDIKVLITTTDFIFDLPSYGYEGDVFAIDVQIDVISGLREPTGFSAESSDVAYVIYTSGSTGVPKGCAITYGNLSNYVQWANNYYYDGTEKASFGLYTSLSFDLTVTSIFCTLTQGGELTVYSQSLEVTTILQDYFSGENSINSIKLTPSHINILRDLGLRSSTVNCAVVGGEAITNGHLTTLKQINPDIKIYNEYGPTEATVGCVVTELQPDNRILIGKPIANTQIFILNNELQLQPVGVPGELCIGGESLGKLYLNQPVLTAEKFVQSPFKAGERIYRTGDLARWLPDGNIEFIGRKDDQVKIRGYRVELGEIENVLLSYSGVKEAAVLAKEDHDGNKSLVAYYVPEKEFGYKSDRIEENKSKGLPEGAKLYGLSENLDIYAYNKTELEFLYQEVFVDQCYLKYGVTIPDNGCIIDIGANIGMFSVFAGMQAKGVTVYAFEPLPPTFELLSLNTSLYPYDYKVFNIGISDKEETATFSYFPNATVLSSRYSEGEAITDIVRQTILNKENATNGDITENELDELLKNRLVTEQFACKLKSLSQIIAENNITQIDYLKIDVEKSEMDVLNGILDEDWKKIKQIVLEIHDVDGRMERIKELLGLHGFRITINQNDYLNETGLYDVYAIAGDLADRTVKEEQHQSLKQWSVEGNLRNGIKEFMASSLPGYMLPSYYVELKEFHFTVNGKLDRKSLPDPEELTQDAGTAYVAPRNETEKSLVRIWEEILGREKIGIKDNFFDLGGHSLKATRLSSQLHKIFDVKLGLKELFAVTVLEQQAELIRKSQKMSFVALEPVALQPDYTLSSAQRRLWVLNQFLEGSNAYHLPGVYVFEGQVDRAALEYAFDALIMRHEALRTVFRETGDGDVRQVILPAEDTDFKISFFDLGDAVNPEEQLEQMIRSSLSAPFDLAAGPLIRASLYRVAADQWVFSYTMHHIISDGWSMNVLINEFLLHYNAQLTGEQYMPSALRIQYKDYAAWQQSRLTGEFLEFHKSYWLKQFEGELPVLDLPADKPRPADKTYNGGFIQQYTGTELLGTLKEFLQKEESTLFMGLLAAVNVLLYRYSGQGDMIIGSPIAGREHADLENQLGFYVNTLALRSRFKGSDNYRSILSVVKELTIDAYDHQVYPFDELVDELSLKRDLSRSPLFDVMVVLQDTDDQQTQKDVAGAKVSAYEAKSEPVSKFDLTFYFAEMAGDLQMNIEYNSDLYDPATVERMGRHLVQLLEALIKSPSAEVDDINYLTEAEQDQLLFDFNDTGAAYPLSKTIIDLFEEQVRLRPGHTALVFDGREISYEELNVWSNQLGDYLRHTYHIVPDDLIGVHLERSEWMIIAILGVLKSGGAYVPIDPEFPEDRVAYMLANSNCKTVINDAELEQFKSGAYLYSKENQPIPSGPDNLVYVMYTSGSTGVPKGCMLVNSGIVNRLEWMWKKYGFGKDDVILQKTTFTFDVSVWELFLPLCWGAKMVLCQKEDISSPERILAIIEQQKVTSLHFVPGMLHVFVSALFQRNDIRESLESLKRVIVSGEALAIETVMKWYAVMDIPVHNLYGPTEASIDVTAYTTSPQDTRSLIGKPISNIQIYISGEKNQLQPIGVTGEICITGDGLAKGYLNQPVLTAEKFVAHPHKSGEKMYRTGDLGKWLPDGNILFLGRKDNQVKIRGYRIEPEEIESALQTYPGIDSSIVLVKVNTSDEHELVAYFIAKTPVNAAQLRAHLGKTLPVYMVPVHYVQLDEFPLTANGKVSRGGLPDPEGGAGISSGVEYVSARNETEEKMVLIWQKILKRENIGVKDDFFALGGHSLKAAQLLSRIASDFSVKLSIQSVFREPTIERVCENIAFLQDQEKQQDNMEKMVQIEI